MLVIISDLHLTDGSTSSNVDPSAFLDILLPEIVDNALDKNAKEVRVILLGDIFDFVRTDHWVNNVSRDDRPWNGTLDPETGMNLSEATKNNYSIVLDKILAHRSSQALIQCIGSIKSRLKTDSMPAIPVTVSYVTGNHDRIVNVYESLQIKIREGFRNIDGFEFLNVLSAPQYGVLARHGHEWDDDNFGYEFYAKILKPGQDVERFDPRCYRVQSIGEVVTAEIMAGFICRLQRSVTDPNICDRIREANNVRPMLDVFLWLEWFARNHILTDHLGDVILTCLRDSLDGLLHSDLASLWTKLQRNLGLFGDLTDIINNIHWFLEGKSFNDVKEGTDIARFLSKIFDSSKDDLLDGAKTELDPALHNDVQYVLYGHTHVARHDYFYAKVDNDVKMYVNTGTFLPLIQRAVIEGFSFAYQMSVVFFYQPEEDADHKKDGKPSMELWNGVKRKLYGVAHGQEAAGLVDKPTTAVYAHH